MKYGHSTGTKQEKAHSQDWYDAIAEANIARVEAEQAALAALTAAAKDALPGQDARIDKGAALVAEHAVWPLTRMATGPFSGKTRISATGSMIRRT